jgi:hypothetical protein
MDSMVKQSAQRRPTPPTPEVGTVPCLLPRSWEFIEYHHLWCGDQRLRERQPGSSLKFGQIEKGKGWQHFGLEVM